MFSKPRMLANCTIFLMLTLSLSTVTAAGQIPGGLTETNNTRLGGTNYIVGTVFTPDGERIRTRMRIRLSTPTWGDILATTNDVGEFVFSNVAAGLYTVIIDADREFQTAMAQVEITKDRPSPPETHIVSLRLRFAGSGKTIPKPSVINAEFAGVPKRAMDFYQKASKLAAAKDYKGAIEQLKLAVAEHAEFVNALNQIGMLYLQLSQPDKADEFLQKALQIRPDAFDPMLNRSVALFRLGRFKDAESILRNAIAAKPEAAVAHYYLGRTLQKTGRDDEAEKAYLTSLKLSPGEVKEAHRFLAAIYLDRGNAQRVIEELETYLKLVPGAPDAENLRKVIEQAKRSQATR
jgi:Flp pilus assembly protein TadD